eukprot:GHVT01066131.1.p1 GENE.GHVT01066131.1~~GHVT01066131.1.p1  ORF type:complete len:294 (-),score=44.28 GHVT01066131.1:381-1262(-)
MPHLLFYGPPGTGKTSAVLALASELFGREEYRSRVLELNASDERGIAVVRDRIKSYTKTNVGRGKLNPTTNRQMPPWKIVVLDEADMMTHDAQAALRRVIEAYSKTTRFVIICNYVHKIIDPLSSRCSRCRFQPVETEAQRERLKAICAAEKLNCPDEALDALLNVSQGDLRRAVMLLQSSSTLYQPITEEAIYNVSGHPPTEVVKGILLACSKSFPDVVAAVKKVDSDGWAIAAVFLQISKLVRSSPDLSDIQKSRMSFALAEKDFAVLSGGDEYLQLMSIAVTIQDILHGL